MDWPQVWLLFVTYKRTQIALRAIESLKQHLLYPNLHWHVCDDGSGKTDDGTDRWHVEVLLEAIGDASWHIIDRQSKSDFNVGGNVNEGMQLARDSGCQIVLMNFDDFGLAHDLDLKPMVDLLDTQYDAGLVRLSYWVDGYSSICVSHKSERLDCEHMWMRLIRKWTLGNRWKTDPYLFSMQPHIAHLRFFDAYGWYPEHTHPGEAEWAMCEKYNGSILGEEGPQILYPMGQRFWHIPYRHMGGRHEIYAKAIGDVQYEDIGKV